jgi:hypothetical protein
MQIKLCGKKWRLLLAYRSKRNYGKCDAPFVKNKAIRIRSDLNGEQRLEILIHEMLHACYWGLAEESVTHGAKDIAHVLWKLGYTDENTNE